MHDLTTRTNRNILASLLNSLRHFDGRDDVTILLPMVRAEERSNNKDVPGRFLNWIGRLSDVNSHITVSLSNKYRIKLSGINPIEAIDESLKVVNDIFSFTEKYGIRSINARVTEEDIFAIVFYYATYLHSKGDKHVVLNVLKDGDKYKDMLEKVFNISLEDRPPVFVGRMKEVVRYLSL